MACANTLVLAMAVTGAALHHSETAALTSGSEVTLEEGLQFIAAQTGTYSFFMTFEAGTGVVVPKGEATNPAGAIEVKSFALGAENPVAIGGATTGSGTGKVKFSGVTITKAVDSASPAIFSNLASGGHMRLLTLIVRRAGVVSSTEYLFWQFGTVFFHKVDWSGEGNGLKETVTMNYGSLRISYARTLSTGALSPPTATQWNQVTNTANFGA